MKTKPTYWFILLNLLWWCSCESIATIALNNNPNLIVVEGWVYDRDTIQTVRLTRTSSFSDFNPIPVINDAQVRVIDQNGNQYLYDYSENGFYVSSRSYSGIPDFRYRLFITTSDNQTIISDWEEMKRNTLIDSVYYEFFIEPNPLNPREDLVIYFPVVLASDPPNQSNFYWWQFERNNLPFDQPEFIYLLSDRFFDGNQAYINKFPEFRFTLGDTITIKVNSITEDAFLFLRELRNQTVNIGTNQGTFPANPKNNLSIIEDERQQVLGYFGTRAVNTGSAVITPNF